MSKAPVDASLVPYLVFISHAGVDNFFAVEVAEQVKHYATAWLDELQIYYGDSFEVEMLDNVQKANELWVLLTDKALTRPYLWLEVGAAWCRNIRIIGVMHGIGIADVVSNSEIPNLIKQRRLVNWDDPGQRRRLLDELDRRSGGAPPTIIPCAGHPRPLPKKGRGASAGKP